MATSIRDYLGINSIGEKQNGEKMSHEEVYSTIVNAIGMDKCIHYLPETKHDILEAYKEDKHLNNIPLAKWDFAHSDFKFELIEIGINSISLSDTVCTLKECARMLARKELSIQLSKELSKEEN